MGITEPELIELVSKIMDIQDVVLIELNGELDRLDDDLIGMIASIDRGAELDRIRLSERLLQIYQRIELLRLTRYKLMDELSNISKDLNNRLQSEIRNKS